MAEEKTSGSSKKLSEHAQEILKMTRDTEFLQSFLRVDLGNDSEADEGGEGRGARVARKSVHEEPVPPPQHLPPQPQPPPPLEAAPQERPRSPRGSVAPGSGRSKKGGGGGGSTTFSQLTRDMKLRKSPRRGRGKRRRGECRQEEVYTDKDRAAAVNMGTRDIKQSLKLKRQEDRSRALQIPEEAEPGTLLALGSHELRNGDVGIAINFVHKALELNPTDKNALVARSKCYLLLGEPKLALQDAETALRTDKTFIRGIFQKAEALYHLGDFEHSLMYYHRGHRLRPELEGFRLGVQKAQEAIENTIGCKTIAGIQPQNLPPIEDPKPAAPPVPLSAGSSEVKRMGSSRSRPSSSASRRQARHLLGELCVDKDYLEQLLKHPDIKCVHQEAANHIASHAEEGIAFLNNRQEFWRQQRPTTTTTNKKGKRQPRNSPQWPS